MFPHKMQSVPVYNEHDDINTFAVGWLFLMVKWYIYIASYVMPNVELFPYAFTNPDRRNYVPGVSIFES